MDGQTSPSSERRPDGVGTAAFVLLLFFFSSSLPRNLLLFLYLLLLDAQAFNLCFTHINTHTHTNTNSCKRGCNQTGSGHHLSLPQRKRMLCLCAHVCTIKRSGKKNTFPGERTWWIVRKEVVHWTLFNNLLKTYLRKYIWTMLEEGPGVNTAGRTGAGMHIKATLSLYLNCLRSKHNTQDFWISEVMSARYFWQILHPFVSIPERRLVCFHRSSREQIFTLTFNIYF